MELKAWINAASDEAREQVAEDAGTSVGYLWQLAGGFRKPSPDLAKAIEAATDGAVTRSDLRPDIWEPTTA